MNAISWRKDLVGMLSTAGTGTLFTDDSYLVSETISIMSVFKPITCYIVASIEPCWMLCNIPYCVCLIHTGHIILKQIT